MELAFEAGSWWAYVLVFLTAATPVIEVAVVIPTAVVAGMPPLPTAVVAFVGNATTVVLATIAGEQIIAWWRRRRPPPQQQGDAPAGRAGRRDRSRRARELARRWGVPGLALLAPVTTGTHIAALAAVATGAGRRRVLGWMAIGLALWTALTAVAAATGLRLLG